MRRHRTSLVALACLPLVLAACSALLDIEAPPSATAGDDGGPGGDAGGSDAGDATTPPDSAPADDASEDSASTPDDAGEDAALPTCAGTTLYVSHSPGASDTNPGCEGTPKYTIAAALAAASAAGTVTAIKVCKGTYAEGPLILDFAASLRGSYDCLNWNRTTGYGYPTFDSTNETVIQNAGTIVSGGTLTIRGSAVTSAQVVDGFTITGATSGTPPAVTVAAVTFQNTAAATLSNNQLTGGGSLGAPSAGVVVLSGSNPTIEKNAINGGSGVPNAPGTASMGISLDGSSTNVTILGNTINGGSGSNSAGNGSGAMHLSGQGTYVVQSNTISAGTGTSTSGIATYGIEITGTPTVTLDANSIDGAGGTSGTACGYGVNVLGATALTLTSNRIYGGNCGVSQVSGLYAVNVEGVAAPVIFNNMIHAGTSTNTAQSAALVIAAANAQVRHNTLIGGPIAGTGAPAAVWLKGSETVFANNILAGSSAQNDGVNLVFTCADAGPPSLASFENNLLFGFPNALVRPSTCSGPIFKTIDDLQAGIALAEPSAVVQGNETIAASCTTSDGGVDTGCIVVPGCTSQSACLTTFFSGWDTTTDGYANLFPANPFAGACPTVSLPTAGKGFTISTSSPLPPCAVTQSSLDDHLIGGLGTDLYGNCRTSTPSMGAQEDNSNDAGCQP